MRAQEEGGGSGGEGHSCRILEDLRNETRNGDTAYFRDVWWFFKLK